MRFPPGARVLLVAQDGGGAWWWAVGRLRFIEASTPYDMRTKRPNGPTTMRVEMEADEWRVGMPPDDWHRQPAALPSTRPAIAPGPVRVIGPPSD